MQTSSLRSLCGPKSSVLYLTGVPFGTGAVTPTSTGLPSTDAARTIPFDSMPINFAGFKFVTMITCLPTKSSGAYASAIPATTVRVSVPRSTVIFNNFFDPCTRSAAFTSATRNPVFRKSSIPILSDAGSAFWFFFFLRSFCHSFLSFDFNSWKQWCYFS